MKYIVLSIIAILISVSVIGANNSSKLTDDKKVTATYKGTTDDNLFEFTNAKGQSIFFEEISDDEPINLYDDENIGLKFTITWIEEEVDVYDEEGELTGETKINKTIIKLVKL